jgi:ATP-dependent DNA helicase RecQ
VPRIALTATADARTRQEIAERLQLQEARHFRRQLRPAEHLLPHRPQGQPPRAAAAFSARRAPAGRGHRVLPVAQARGRDRAWLQEQGFNALPYHAGLPSAMRETHQRRFLREEGVIIVATIAFGMGIDKPDVRFVAHLDLPKTVEAYYQETGRAGRDGQPADAWLVYGLQDVITLRQMLRAVPGHEQYRREEQNRLNAMLGLCEIISCRRQALLAYFGEDWRALRQLRQLPDPRRPGTARRRRRWRSPPWYRTGQRFGVNHLIDVLRGVENDKIFRTIITSCRPLGSAAKLDAKTLALGVPPAGRPRLSLAWTWPAMAPSCCSRRRVASCAARTSVALRQDPKSTQ